MQIDLTGKVAIVTGAARGIGAEICRTLIDEGVTTVALDVSDDALAPLAAEIGGAPGGARASGARLHPYACDIRDSRRVTEVVENVRRSIGRIDILVNNAGVVSDAPIDELPEAAWDFVHDVNLKGTFLMCQAVIPAMKRQGWGRIINAASYAAITPRIGSVAYATSKAAVVHFTRGLAGELGPWGITVNAYAPGMVPTAINHFTERPGAEQDALLNTLTLRRWGSAGDVSRLVCFLASELAGYITGTLIDVSGGKLATQFPQEAYQLADVPPVPSDSDPQNHSR